MATTTLSSLARACDKELSGIVGCVQASEYKTRWHTFDDSLGRLRVWAENLGAYQTPESRSSLDYRLRDGYEMRDAIQEGLENLCEWSTKASKIINGMLPNRMFPNVSAETNVVEATQNSELDELCSGIEGVINVLFRLLMVISQNRPKGKIALPDAFLQQDPTLDIVHVLDRFSKTKETPWLADRLGRCIHVGPARKSYLLAPDWSFPPDGAIALGNIIVDPEKPHRIVRRLQIEGSSARVFTEVNHVPTTMTRSTTTGVEIDVFSKFLEIAGMSASASATRFSEQHTWTYDRLETSYLVGFEGLLQETQLAVLRSLNTFSRRFYMITSVKIARNFSFEHRTSNTSKLGGGLESMENDLAGQKKAVDGASQPSDVVFSYGLTLIKFKRSGGVTTEAYYPKHAFL